MTTKNHSDGAGSPAAEPSQLLKTDVLGRTRMSRAQRESMLDIFENSSMTGQAFALQHGIKIQTFASWIQKRRRAVSVVQNAFRECHFTYPNGDLFLYL